MSGTPFTEAEQAALDAVDEIAERPSMQLQASQQPGDVVWVNNLAVMHRRERYVDHDDPAQRRLLYRMWLNNREPAAVIAEQRDAARRQSAAQNRPSAPTRQPERSDENGGDERGDADEP